MAAFPHESGACYCDTTTAAVVKIKPNETASTMDCMPKNVQKITTHE